MRVVVSRPAALVRALTAALAFPIAGPILLTAIGKAVGPPGGGPPGWLDTAILLFLALGAFVGTVGAMRSRDTGQRLEVEPDALILGARKIAKRDIESGILVVRSDYDRVELQLRGGEPLVIDMPAGEGASLLEELGLGATQRRAHIPLTSPAEQALIRFGGGAVGLIGLVMLFGLATMVIPEAVMKAIMAAPAFAPGAAGGAALVALGSGVTFARGSPDVVIGVDGVSHATPGLGRRAYAFTSFSAVERVEVETGEAGRAQAAHVVLVGPDEARTTVASLHVTKREQTEAIAGRIRAALAVFRSGEGGEVTPIQRESMPVPAWLDGLRKLGRARSGDRSARPSSKVTRSTSTRATKNFVPAST